MIYNLVVNPSNGSLQFILSPASKKTIPIYEEVQVQCKTNQIYIANSFMPIEFFLPKQPKETDWIKIFAREGAGWILRITQENSIIDQSTMRILNDSFYIHSNMHSFDFIHLIFLGHAWFIENKSPTVGISENV